MYQRHCGAFAYQLELFLPVFPLVSRSLPEIRAALASAAVFTCGSGGEARPAAAARAARTDPQTLVQTLQAEQLRLRVLLQAAAAAGLSRHVPAGVLDHDSPRLMVPHPRPPHLHMWLRLARGGMLHKPFSSAYRAREI